jgi:hypothetical protein
VSRFHGVKIARCQDSIDKACPVYSAAPASRQTRDRVHCTQYSDYLLNKRPEIASAQRSKTKYRLYLYKYITYTVSRTSRTRSSPVTTQGTRTPPGPVAWVYRTASVYVGPRRSTTQHARVTNRFSPFHTFVRRRQGPHVRAPETRSGRGTCAHPTELSPACLLSPATPTQKSIQDHPSRATRRVSPEMPPSPSGQWKQTDWQV